MAAAPRDASSEALARRAPCREWAESLALPGSVISDERLEEPRSPARATMKNYFTHSGKQESREVTITDLDMGTFDYFCNPSIFGKNAGAGQCSKRLASAAGGATPLSLGKMQGQGSAAKIGERYRWGATPLSLAKMQGQGSAVKNWRALPLGGYPSSLGKMQGQGSATKIGERYRWGATPLSLGKMQGQGSAVKSWSALLGNAGAGQCRKNWRALPLGATLYLWENARAGQCSKRLASAAGGLPHYLWEKCRGRAVQQKLASDAGGYPFILQEQGSAAKNLASATAGGRPLYLWEKHGSPNPYENPIG